MAKHVILFFRVFKLYYIIRNLYIYIYIANYRLANECSIGLFFINSVDLVNGYSL